MGCDIKTIQNYYSILEDTLIGFSLPAFHGSFRKRLSKAPKFYFFDAGVVSALSNVLSVPLIESTSAYGEAFEHFIILECKKLASYFYPEYKFSHLRTKENVEIDLIVERPGKTTLLIEIKSSDQVRDDHLKRLHDIAKEFDNVEAMCFSRDPYPKKMNNIQVYPWRDGVMAFFGRPE